MKISLVLGLFFILATMTVLAAHIRPLRRSKELERLNFLVGSWVTEEKMMFDPSGRVVELMGEAEFSWQLENIWLKHEYSVPIGPDSKLAGTGFFTWDETKQEFVNHWIDNFSTIVATGTGNFNEKGDLVTIENSRKPDSSRQERFTWSKEDDDTVRFTMEQSSDGSHFQTVISSIYRRK